MQRVSCNRLVRDLHAVAADVDELIESAAGGATAAIAKARERLEASLEAVRQNLKRAGRGSAEEANTARQSQAYFQVNAWKAIGVAAGIGIVLGAIAGQKGGLSRARREGPK